MRNVFLVSTLLLLPICAASQVDEGKRTLTLERASEVCHANVLPEDSKSEVIKSIEAKFTPLVPKTEKITLVVIDSDVVNAFERNLDGSHGIICVPKAMVTLLGDAEAELAFLIGHEAGHALDPLCKSLAGRSAIVPHGSATQQQKGCELRADAIGFTMLRRAGYSPFAAAGAFGRLEMVRQGATSTGLLTRLRAGDHPITPDRIENLHKLLLRDAATAALAP